MSSYAEKLKDPRWQKKRLEIFERDDWICQRCGDEESPLHVHHLRYAKSGNPWDSPFGDLVTLCEECHKLEKEIYKDLKEIKRVVCEIIDGCDLSIAFLIQVYAEIFRYGLKHPADYLYDETIGIVKRYARIPKELRDRDDG